MPHTPRRALRGPSAGAVVAALLVLTGCSSGGGAQQEEAGGDDGPKVIQPGRPGESAREVDPTSVEPSDEWNHTDVAYVQMMIPHHAQAVQMARLADKHAKDTRVRTLAERIGAGQAPEIQTMAAWLKQRDMEVPRAGEAPGKYDHSKHGHNAMMGMLTPAEMKRLAAARDTEFDRLFLRGMIRHHRGAVAMSQQAARDGADVIVGEMTADVNATQSAEINRMRDLLARL
ncbi:MAG TPA: DUF305 domain-containing protein [Marmoricola sp.]|nr:DUF305 domain-containing protein [Marmoricola sp.]